jgi:hypothetical protein
MSVSIVLAVSCLAFTALNFWQDRLIKKELELIRIELEICKSINIKSQKAIEDFRKCLIICEKEIK